MRLLTVEFSINKKLGDYTTEEDGKEIGDHAIVFMFQPFCGQWVQALACFLSKGITGDLLTHLLLECIILLESSGFQVDCVTMDGLPANRKVWTQFGVEEGEGCSCSHPLDEEDERQLWFISDFPHLIKNLRNFIVSQPSVHVRSIVFWHKIFWIIFFFYYTDAKQTQH